MEDNHPLEGMGGPGWRIKKPGSVTLLPLSLTMMMIWNQTNKVQVLLMGNVRAFGWIRIGIWIFVQGRKRRFMSTTKRYVYIKVAQQVAGIRRIQKENDKLMD